MGILNQIRLGATRTISNIKGKMKYLLYCLAVVLTACGGGGSTPIPVQNNSIIQSSAALMAPGQKMTIAWVDYRFDEPTEINTDGVVMTSYNGMTPMIDHIKNVGYNTIVLQTEVPVSPQTGLLDTNEIPNQPRTLPKDFWRVVDYAKMQGFQVWIMLAITDGLDNTLYQGQGAQAFGGNFSADTMFTTITNYDTNLAVLAQQHKVDGIYLGDYQLGFDQSQYITNWKTLVSSVKSVFTGKLSYISGNDSPVYDLVDYISVQFNWPLMSTVTTDVPTIVNSYYNAVNGFNVVKYVEDISAAHGNKPLILDHFQSTAVDTGVGQDVNIWNLLANGQMSSLPTPNYVLQSAKISAFCSISTAITPVVGIGFDEYMPWAQAAWLQNAVPGTDNYNWYLFDALGYELYNRPQEESTISQCVKNLK